MNDPDPGQSTTSAAAADAPAATDPLVSVILHADVPGQRECATLPADMRTAARAALEVAEIGRAEMTLVITDDSQIRTLNRQFRGIDRPTNVLSFPEPEHTPHPAGGETPFAGDVVVSLDTLVREAAQQQKSLAAHAAHLVVHGVLHLFGYDHDTDEKAARMEALEVKALSRLGFLDPYAEPQLMES
jgi:probable rRNA maturation factor